MFNLQGSEIIVILLLALVVLGPEKLPGAIRRFTKTYAELKKMGTSFQDEVKSAFDEPMREVRETADLIKQQVDVDALEADAASTAATAEQASPTIDDIPAPADEQGNGAAVLPEPEAGDLPAAMPPPVAGMGRPGPNAVPAPPNVPAPPPPFSGSSPAETAGNHEGTPTSSPEEESSP